MENCPQRKEACLRCTEPVPFAQMDDHLQNRCMLRPVECPNGCGKRGLKAQDLTVNYHASNLAVFILSDAMWFV